MLRVTRILPERAANTHPFRPAFAIFMRKPRVVFRPPGAVHERRA
ncbi:hypothetical protein LG3211_0202 [Lysobacter gummosus]|nr:hypothetical protein LG3211_0202 [Lysobacter gummosus]